MFRRQQRKLFCLFPYEQFHPSSLQTLLLSNQIPQVRQPWLCVAGQHIARRPVITNGCVWWSSQAECVWNEMCRTGSSSCSIRLWGSLCSQSGYTASLFQNQNSQLKNNHMLLFLHPVQQLHLDITEQESATFIASMQIQLGLSKDIFLQQKSRYMISILRTVMLLFFIYRVVFLLGLHLFGWEMHRYQT